MKTFVQLREETSGETIRVSREIYEAVLRTINEETEYYTGYSDASMKHAKAALAAAHKSGLKINHEGHGRQGGLVHTGNTAGSKPHEKPDISVHYERGDTPHLDGHSGITLHTAAAKAHAALNSHSKKAQSIADKETDN